LTVGGRVTHGVVVGMTGSGKTGLVTVLVEEAARVEGAKAVVEARTSASEVVTMRRVLA